MGAIMAKSAVTQWDETAANNTDVGGVNIAEGCAPSNLNNAQRAVMAQVAQLEGDDTVASAATTDLGSVPGRYVTVSGTTTITGLGTIKAGTLRFVTFSGALIVTHNGTSLILPGGANITTAAGDTAVFVSEGSGNWRCLDYQRATGRPVNGIVPIYRVREEQNSGTNSAGASSTTWADIVLNTEETAGIAGASLSSNQVTLPAGTYDVFGEFTYSLGSTNAANIRTRLYDVSNATVLLESPSIRAHQNLTQLIPVVGRITLVDSTVVAFQARSSTSGGGTGTAGSLGDVEIYSGIAFEKVA